MIKTELTPFDVEESAAEIVGKLANLGLLIGSGHTEAHDVIREVINSRGVGNGTDDNCSR